MLAGARPPIWLGVLTAVGAVAAITALIYPVRGVAPAVSTGVLYLIAVLAISIVWGLWLGLATCLASAIAFNFFHIPPTGQFTIADGEDWVALVTFFIAAVVASSLAELARTRAAEAEERGREAQENLDRLLEANREREALEAEAIEARALRRSDELKTALLRSVSHDLRSPLTAILAAGEALGSSAVSDEDRTALAETIGTEGSRLTRVIENLLDLSRLEAGAADPRRDWTSIEEVAQTAVEQVAPQHGAKLSIDPEVPLVRADGAQLERAMVNVIENAARHSGGHPISVRGAPGRQQAGGPRRGPGAGIPTRTSSACSRRSNAAPPTATVTRRRPRARDRPRLRRSERRSYLRRVAARPGHGVRDRAAGGGGVSEKRRARVLVCDDEPQIVRALKVLLREAGFDSVVAETAEQAIDRASVRPPDAAIIDLVLPDGDGIEVTRQLREWSQMPIIVLSAIGEEDEKVRALQAGADDYVTKPFAPRELVARVEAALRRSGAKPDEPTISADGLEIDLAARLVRRDGEEVHLTPIEFDLLRVLAGNRGRLMTHRALLTEVWGPGYADDTQVLRTHIANLRRKIEPGGAAGGGTLIRTDPGVGYRFSG